MTNNPITVPEIGLRIIDKAWCGLGDRVSSRSFVGFVTDRQNLMTLFPDIPSTDVSDTEAHDLAVEYLKQIWPPDTMATVTIENISLDNKRAGLYLLKPPVEGAVTAGYGTDRGVPAFRCLVQDGFFVGIDVEAGFYSQQPGSEEVVLTGPVYAQIPPAPGTALVKTRPPKSLPAEVLESIANLKLKRLLVSQQLENWFSFLDWSQEVINRKQIACRYHSFEIDEARRCLSFSVRVSAEEGQKLSARKSFPVSAMSLSASNSPESWAPLAGARGVSLGELAVPQKQIKAMLSSRTSGEELVFVFEIYPDSETWDESLKRIPEEGFLVSEIYANIIPLQRQRTALEKLIKGEYLNPLLPDFVFDAAKARIPDAPVLGLEEADAEYLRKAFSSP